MKYTLFALALGALLSTTATPALAWSYGGGTYGPSSGSNGSTTPRGEYGYDGNFWSSWSWIARNVPSWLQSATDVSRLNRFYDSYDHRHGGLSDADALAESRAQD